MIPCWNYILRIFCCYTKYFIHHNLINNMFHFLHIKLVAFHMLFYLSKKLHLIRLIVHSEIFFFQTVRFFELNGILHFDWIPLCWSLSVVWSIAQIWNAHYTKSLRFCFIIFKDIRIQFSFEEDCMLIRKENPKTSKKSVEKEMRWWVAMSGGSLCRYVI